MCAVPAAGIVAEAMVALVLADAVAEKFGGDSVAETRRNVRSYLDNLADPVSAAPPSSWSARWASASPPSAQLLAERLGAGLPGHRRRHRGRRRAGTIAEIFVDEGEPPSARSRGRPCARRSPSTTASSRSAAARSSTRTPARCWPGSPVVYLSMDVEEAVKRTGLNAARPLLAVNPRQQWRELMEARRHLYTEVARPSWPPTAAPPKRSPSRVLDALELKEA